MRLSKLLQSHRLLLLTTVMRSVRGEQGACAAAGGSCDDSSFFIWRDEVDSTMDEARRLLAGRPDGTTFAVAAGRQTRGRGTRGRTWSDGDGNVKLTVAIPTKALPLAPVTLLPLRIGVLVHGVLAPYLCGGEALKLKWPNDVLLDSKKLAGTLVEMESPFLLVGIGVNLNVAPPVPTDGRDTGRQAASLVDNDADCGQTIPDAATLSRQLADAVRQWATSGLADTSVVDEWTRLADWTTPLRLRPEAQGPSSSASSSEENEQLLPLRLQDDGRLRVVPLNGGPERSLVAEYLL